MIQRRQKVIISAPAPGDTVTYLTDVVGSVTAADLEFTRIDYARSDLIDHDNFAADNAAWVTIAESIGEATDAVLATFDPTVLANNDYLIRIFAQDFSGKRRCASDSGQCRCASEARSVQARLH